MVVMHTPTREVQRGPKGGGTGCGSDTRKNPDQRVNTPKRIRCKKNQCLCRLCCHRLGDVATAADIGVAALPPRYPPTKGPGSRWYREEVGTEISARSSDFPRLFERVASIPVVVLALTLFLSVPTVAQGQVGGRVLRPDGSPLPDVSVEVWGRAVMLHVTHTDGRGYFRLPQVEQDQVARYVFRHLGFGVEIIQSDDFHEGMEVSMREGLAFELERLTVTVSRDPCPQPDEIEARDLWIRASSRYSQATSIHGLGGWYGVEQKDVNEHSVFSGLDGDLNVGLRMEERWSAGERVVRGRVLTLEQIVPAVGYAWPRNVTEPEYYLGRDRHLNWIYAALDTRSANHFATPVFGSLHSFSIEEETDSTTTIRFCSTERGRHQPYLRGTILIGDDGEMKEANWRFETGDPREEAGGWVSFTTARDPHGGPPHLVADRSLFFRNSGLDAMHPDMARWVFREIREWSGWTVAAGSAEPTNLGVGSGDRES